MDLSAVTSNVEKGYILWSDKDVLAMYNILWKVLSPSSPEHLVTAPLTIIFSDGNKIHCEATTHPNGAYYIDQYVLFPKNSYTWAIQVIDNNIYPGGVRKLKFFRMFYNFIS